eukprot:scaffold38674_cov37-Prasinocladus_malaysianus.AAC.2
MSFECLPDTADRDELTCNMDGVPTDESNLVIKSLHLIQQTCAFIHWTGAGLGGGSANAATALFAANKLCGELATEDDLLNWSADIGSDISVFFSQ